MNIENVLDLACRRLNICEQFGEINDYLCSEYLITLSDLYNALLEENTSKNINIAEKLKCEIIQIIREKSLSSHSVSPDVLDSSQSDGFRSKLPLDNEIVLTVPKLNRNTHGFPGTKPSLFWFKSLKAQKRKYKRRFANNQHPSPNINVIDIKKNWKVPFSTESPIHNIEPSAKAEIHPKYDSVLYDSLLGMNQVSSVSSYGGNVVFPQGQGDMGQHISIRYEDVDNCTKEEQEDRGFAVGEETNNCDYIENRSVTQEDHTVESSGNVDMNIIDPVVTNNLRQDLNWEIFLSPEGYPYHYCSETDESEWVCPHRNHATPHEGVSSTVDEDPYRECNCPKGYNLEAINVLIFNNGNEYDYVNYNDDDGHDDGDNCDDDGDVKTVDYNNNNNKYYTNHEDMELREQAESANDISLIFSDTDSDVYDTHSAHEAPEYASVSSSSLLSSTTHRHRPAGATEARHEGGGAELQMWEYREGNIESKVYDFNWLYD